MKPDAHIQQDVLAQIKWNPLLTTSEIDVSVEDGVVTLTGQVDSYNKKLQAVKEAKKIHGVTYVAEVIQVRLLPGQAKQDDEITEMVMYVLQWQNHIPEGKINVKVTEGTVFLEGEVEWEFQRNAATNAVIHLKGVRNVNNRITLKPIVTPFDLKYRIREALCRSVTIDAEKITIDVIGHKAILKGNVRSFAEKENAEKAAWAAPGIIDVESILVIEEHDQKLLAQKMKQAITS